MSELERLAGECLLPGFEGFELPDWVRRLAAEGVGGFVLFARNVRDRGQLAALTGALRSERPDLLIAIDEEGGDVTRLEAETGSSYPGNYALGAVDDIGLTENVGRAIGQDLTFVGVNLNLAPVADVNTNPENPIVGVRSFGSEAELVARHVGAFVAGLQSAGVAACAKHFPGHGDTDLDSHRELPTVRRSEEALGPFRAAIAAGVQAVMTAHIRVEGLDDSPATLSPAIVGGLLRGELGFDGLVLSDALEMQAVSGTVGVQEGAVRALAAGVHALCLGAVLGERDFEDIRLAIVEAVRDRRLPEERVVEAAQRVTGFDPPARLARATVSREIGLEAARRALRTEGAVSLARAPLVVELRPPASIAAGEMRHGLAALLPGAIEAESSDACEMLGDRQLVLVLRDAHRHPWQRERANALVAAARDAIVVEVGLPEWRPPGAAGYLRTYGAGRVNLVAAGERLTALKL